MILQALNAIVRMHGTGTDEDCLVPKSVQQQLFHMDETKGRLLLNVDALGLVKEILQLLDNVVDAVTHLATMVQFALAFGDSCMGKFGHIAELEADKLFQSLLARLGPGKCQVRDTNIDAHEPRHCLSASSSM